MIDLATLDSSRLTPLIGETVTIRHGEQSATLEISEVREIGNRRPDSPREPFAIAFRGKPGLRVQQSIYQLEHPALGVLEIFITQTGDGPQGSEFESVFT